MIIKSATNFNVININLTPTQWNSFQEFTADNNS